jgi:orotidine-5'-phosphate decarboxylase
MSFGDRLAAQVAARESQIVLGIDPDPARLWPDAAGAIPASGSPAELAAAAVTAHCAALIDAAAAACVACKPQLACFERLGAPGWTALAATVAHARDAGLLVILDAKRGDIDVSAAAYAQGFLGSTPTPFGEVEGLRGDAVTVNPLLGRDSLAPFVDVARANDAGLFVLVRTSNPGAADVQDLPVGDATVHERLAAIVGELGEQGTSGIADVGAVAGATAPEHLARLRELMPAAPFLLPGIGAQGGRVGDLVAAFAPGRAGGLVSASRSIARAHEADPEHARPADAARVEAERLRAAAWSLS